MTVRKFYTHIGIGTLGNKLYENENENMYIKVIMVLLQTVYIDHCSTVTNQLDTAKIYKHLDILIAWLKSREMFFRYQNRGIIF